MTKKELAALNDLISPLIKKQPIMRLKSNVTSGLYNYEFINSQKH